MENFKNALSFVKQYNKSRKGKPLLFIRLSIKNGHPFIYFTPFLEKSEAVMIHFFNNGKVQLTLHSAVEQFYETVIFDKGFDCSFKNIMSIVESNIYPPHLNHIELYIDNKEVLKFNYLVKKELMSYLANDILFKRNIDGFFVEGETLEKIHIKNYKTDDYGVILISRKYVKLFKKEKFNNKVIYSILMKDVFIENKLMESYLDKELKKLKTKIYKFF